MCFLTMAVRIRKKIPSRLLGSTTVSALRARGHFGPPRPSFQGGCRIQAADLACMLATTALSDPSCHGKPPRTPTAARHLINSAEQSPKARISSLNDFETSALKHSTDYRGTVASLLVALARRSSAYSDVPGVLTTWRPLSCWIRHRRHRRRRRSRFLVLLGAPCRTAPSSHRRT